MMGATMKKTILSMMLVASGIALQAADDPAGSSDCCTEATSLTSAKAEHPVAAQSSDAMCSEDSCCCCGETTTLTSVKAGHSTAKQANSSLAKTTANARTKPVLLSPKAMDLASR